MIQNSEFFQFLSTEDKQFLMSGMVKRTAAKRNVIRAGSGGFIYFLESGMVKTALDNPPPKMAFTGFLITGGFWNIQALLNQQHYVEYAEVVSNEACYIPMQVWIVQQLMDRNPEFNGTMQNNIGKYINKLEQRFVLTLNHRDVKSRLKVFLFQYAQEFGRKSG